MLLEPIKVVTSANIWAVLDGDSHPTFRRPSRRDTSEGIVSFASLPETLPSMISRSLISLPGAARPGECSQGFTERWAFLRGYPTTAPVWKRPPGQISEEGP